jgi:periplasmic protein TonB
MEIKYCCVIEANATIYLINLSTTKHKKMNSNQPSSNNNLSYLDILYQGRNKAYGGYELRQHYEQRLRNAMLLMLSSVSICILLLANNVEAKPSADTKNNVPPIKITEVHNTKVDLPKQKSEAPKTNAPKQKSTAPPKTSVATRVATTVPTLTIVDNHRTAEPIKPNLPTGPTIADLRIPTGPANQGGLHTSGGTATSGGGTAASGIKQKANSIFDKEGVDELPDYPGGKAKLLAFLNANLNYPEEAREGNVETTVTIDFVVNEDGSINISTQKEKDDYGFLQEAMRVLRMMPKWKPGKVGGEPVKCYFSIPVQYTLQ